MSAQTSQNSATRTSPTLGKFVWHELMTPDPRAAAAFYADVIGWSAADAGMQNGDYTLFSAGPVPVAGLMGIPPQAASNGAPAGWRPFISVPDTDDFAAKVTQAGGVVHFGPEDIPGVGRFASVTDAQGAAFVLFTSKPGSEIPMLKPGAPGSVGWNELAAVDCSSALDFYARLFGWTQSTAHDMGPMGTYQLFAADGVDAGGIVNRSDPAVAPHWVTYFSVASASEAAGRIKAGGGKVLNGPMPVPGGNWVVQAQDPQGVLFAIVATAA
jgi:predicted enzyme related to lactoylglutathione lyase